MLLLRSSFLYPVETVDKQIKSKFHFQNIEYSSLSTVSTRHWKNSSKVIHSFIYIRRVQIWNKRDIIKFTCFLNNFNFISKPNIVIIIKSLKKHYFLIKILIIQVFCIKWKVHFYYLSKFKKVFFLIQFNRVFCIVITNF